MNIHAASPIRRRAGRIEMAERADALLAIIAEMQPMTVRQVFYQASVRGIVDKPEAGYNRVQRVLVDLRRSGRLPWDHIADNTRWQRRPTTWRDPNQALQQTARHYRKSLWSEAEDYVEVWLEKDALSAVVYDVTDEYDVPLMVARGYASVTFLHQAASDIEVDGRPAYLYHLSDYDPSGVDAANKVELSLRAFAPTAQIQFTRLAVLPSQIERWDLPTRPTETSDSRAKGFGSISVELDAIDPHRLRAIVRKAIVHHLPPEQFAVLNAAEESERLLISAWASHHRGTA
jgi:hypothetical protein